MKVLVLAFCLSLLLAGIAPAADSLNVRLIGSWDSPGHAYDVALGGNYAYVAAETAGLRVISVADPAHPAEVGHCGTPGHAYGVAVNGDYAYIADFDSGLRVISVADPAHPVEVGHCGTPGPAYRVAVSGSHAYVTNYDHGLRVISIADPANPVEVGYYAPPFPDAVSGVAVAGDNAYVADGGSGLCVVSVADPTNPVEVGRCGPPVTARAVAVAGNFAYVADGQSGLRVISVADPSHPTEVGHLDSLGRVTMSVAVDGGYAYVTNSSFNEDWNGLRVVSVADPANPVEVGHYQLSNASETFYSVALGGGCVYMTHWPALKILEFYGGGVEEKPSAEVRRTNSVPTIVRNVLLLLEASSHKPQAASLLDASGRKVLDLRPGANDVSRLSPGVYFVREAQAQAQAQAVRKVVIAK